MLHEPARGGGGYNMAKPMSGAMLNRFLNLDRNMNVSGSNEPEKQIDKCDLMIYKALVSTYYSLKCQDI